MNKIFLLGLFALAACREQPQTAVSEIYLNTPDGQSTPIGLVLMEDTPNGLLLNVDLQNLPQGEHGFHVHENPDCSAAKDANGALTPSLAAGGHYDTKASGIHSGPQGSGHKGDLPALVADEQGVVKTKIIAPRLKVKEVKNRALVIHAGGDNYQDTPQPLGGGGARIACGIIKYISISNLLF